MAVYKFALTGILAIIAGIIVLIFPKVLNIAVGLWLIITGALSFFPDF